jgi:DNA-binding winged helix-turn-helix (wHTH) protein/tetratricopeptide (TPR) repeat protein
MRYRVGDHVLDTRKFELRDGDRLVAAEPQVLSLLFLLIENRDRLVSKDELVETIWDGRAVSDSAISSRIKSARKLLGDDGDAQRLIRTVHGKGFRFVGDVSVDETMRDGTVSAAPGPNAVERPILFATLGITALASIGILLWSPWRASAVTVAVTAATASPQSDALARDLTAKLGMFSSANEGAARLVDPTGSQSADLRFEVDVAPDGHDVAGNLLLLNNRRDLLWSRDFRQPQSKLADLKQQLGFAAGKVLNCALDTIAKGAPRLEPQVVKLYLNGCGGFADLNQDNALVIERIFQNVVDAAPRFQAGWRKLLLVEAAGLNGYLDSTQADLNRARDTVAAAQKINPALPEISLVQAEMAPSTRISERMRLVETAVHAAPANADIGVIHAQYLLNVGRSKDAVTEAKRSVQEDPLSPLNRESAVIALGYAGRTAEAERELREAEALWPGASSLREARFLLYLRFADPKEAIRLRQSGLPMPDMSPFVGSFLTARVDPTPANVELALRDARAVYARTPMAISHLAQVLGAFHREEELFPILLNWQYPDQVDQITDVLVRPALRNFRHDPRFMRVAARLGLLQYWQSSGNWPDFCFDSDLPYDCKKVGAAVARNT